MDETIRTISAGEAARVEYRKNKIQKGEELKEVLADMQCLAEESPQSSSDDLYDVADAIGRCKAAEIAFANPVATSFVLEPLPNGETLLLFRASDHGYGYTVGAQVLSADCLADLCLVAQAHPHPTGTDLNIE